MIRYLIILLLLSSCSISRPKVPLGTVPPPTMPTPQEEAQGRQVLEQLTKQYPLDYDHPKYELLVDVIDRLGKAAGGTTNRWHVYLLKGDEVKNAAATKGNHLFFWTGMLDFASTEGAIATVAAHEMAHVLARHTEPSSSKTIADVMIRVAAIAASVATATAMEGAAGAQDVGRVAGAVTQEVGKGIFTNPYSQELESEADEVGLFLMKRAGYNPRDAIKFWEKFAGESGAALSFFSTHPPAEDRLARLKELLPIVEGASSKASGPSTSSSNGVKLYSSTSVDSEVLSVVDPANLTIIKRVGSWYQVPEGYVLRREVIAKNGKKPQTNGPN